MRVLTPEQEVRMRTMELVRAHYAGALVNGLSPTPDWLVSKAKPIEKYVLFGNDHEAATAEGY